MNNAAGTPAGSSKEQQRVKQMKQSVENLKNFNLPSTESAVDALEHVKTSRTSGEIRNELSDTGKKILDDVNVVLSTTQKMLTEKNAGDDFQKMMRHSKRATDLTNMEKLKSVKGQGSDVKYNMSFSYSSIVSIVKLLVSSSEFRRAAKELVETLVDILKYNLGDSSEETLNQSRNALDSLNADITEANNRDKGTRETLHSIVDKVADTVETVVPEETRQNLKERAKNEKNEIQEGNKSKRSAARQAVSETMETMKGKASSMEMTDEHRDLLISRLKQNLKAFQYREDFQRSVDDLIHGLEGLFESTKTYAANQKGKGKDIVPSEAEVEWKEASSHAQNLIENIFGGNSISSVISSIRSFITDLQNDSDLFDKFKRWKEFIQRLIKDPNFVDSDQFRVEARDLADSTKGSLNDHYRGQGEVIVEDMQHFLTGITEDPTNQEFFDSFRQLWNDALFDEYGNLTMKRELASDLSHVLPILSDKIMWIPLPRFEHDDEKVFFQMDDVILQCSGLIPKHFKYRVKLEGDLVVPEVRGDVGVNLSHIQAKSNNITFSLRIKRGFWKFLSDSGKIDFDVYGNGLSFDLNFVPWYQQGEKGLETSRCDIHIDKLRLRLYNTRHDFLFKMFRPIIQKIVKKQIENLVSKNLRKFIEHGYDSGSGVGEGSSTGNDEIQVIDENGNVVNNGDHVSVLSDANTKKKKNPVSRGMRHLKSFVTTTKG